ncbi:MAG: hypothetical protein ABI220_05045 [Candidatus Saccharimonadales bacterium]
MIVDLVGLAAKTPVAAVQSPDTGYDTPDQSNPIAEALIIGAVISTSAGLALLYKQKQSR